MAATATARRTTSTKAKAKPAPEPEPELEEDDLEELADDEATETPAKASKVDEVTFGVRDLCDLLSKETGEEVTPRGLRTLIRKMARDGKGRVEREIVAGNRTRYDWSGPTDPEVKKIIAAYKGGELEADKQEKLAKLKADKDAKMAAKRAAQEAMVEEDAHPAKATKTTRTKAKPAPVVEVEDDDDDELSLDDDE